MLEPDGRAALTEQLRPPSGFQLSHAIATTFTLDLTTALSVPLSFATHRIRDSNDPIALLDAVRRAADKVDVFAQAGQVFEPRVTSDLFALLEPMVHPVAAPRTGMLFHPKIWVLEYADGESHSYRMLCASRNLTADRSWDLVVRLDGHATGAPTPQSAPLATFVRALSGMAINALPQDRADRIDRLADVAATVEWERPADVRSVRFHPYGIPSVAPEALHKLFDGVRHGIISPFVTDDGIDRVVPPRSRSITLLSRAGQLERLNARTLAKIGDQSFVLDDATNDDDVEDARLSSTSADAALVGLHAKAYVLDRGTGSHLFVGSANATNAAFGGNVEFMVEFEGPQTKLGVAALLGEESHLRALMVQYKAVGNAETPADEEADHVLEHVLRDLAMRRYAARVQPDIADPDDSAIATTDEVLYAIELSADGAPKVPAGMTAQATLLTRRANSRPVPGDAVVFDRLELTDITPFIVIRVTDARGKQAGTVVTASLTGDISGRQDAVIARQLADRASFMQLLALLLAIDGGDGFISFDAPSPFAAGWADDGSGLFETLVRALGVEHGGLTDVRRIVEQVRIADRRRPSDAPPVLPEGFEELWGCVWAAYTEHVDDSEPRRTDEQ